ncbi:hypothetical protein FE257_010638 [Aspergillus nanangensis]|uniref:Zn(2)-C6 fungal-type domain-containing protein n=1 Tax=Aspergillus nanangensis TaxID=2582783 RepID=A0AAD4GRX2_ASPNN|nr:hypothetical protein FE257_010638 [Aspergillus nanangensis]
MSDPNRLPFHYPSYSAPSDLAENEPTFSDWANPQYAQSYFGPPITYDMSSGFTETPGASRTNPGDRSFNSKVPIPRSTNPSSWTSSGRVSRACENCREQKAKCSGHRPTCQRCQESGIRCSYGDRKREKMAKQLSDLISQVQVYEALLREISPKLDLQSAQYVDQVMNEQKFENDQTTSGRKPSNSSSTSRGGIAESPMISSTVLNSSLGALDYTNEDFNRDEKTQAIGFVGEHSEMAWLYRLKRLLDQPSSAAFGESWDRHTVASVNFFQDDSDTPVIDNIDHNQKIPQNVSDKLVEHYFQMAHPSFPIVGKVLFLRQYKSYYSSSTVYPNKRWLAILNLIFAIATRCSRQDDSDTPSNDDLLYFSRAWKLSMSDVALLDHPNLQQVQVEGLTSFYLASIGQVNRSWRICGISIRSAVTMGLNLRSESSSVGNMSKETRYRVWWSIYMLDISLSVITGRPPNCADDFCTTPLPVPFREEEFLDDNIAQLIGDNEARSIFMESLALRAPGTPTIESIILPEPGSGFNKEKPCEQVASSAVKSLIPNNSLFFLHIVDLGLIMRESIEKLYAPGAARKSWAEIEMEISSLTGKADAWLTRLPAAFHFTQGTKSFDRQRLNLAFHFYSAKILMTQPCLSRLTRQILGTETPGSFCDAMAAMCVDLASQMLDLLPDLPNSSWIYSISPWWFVLHYLMQSTAVLLTELLLLAKKGSTKYKRVLDKITKSCRWLAEMSPKDASFQRAQSVCWDLLSQHAPEFDIEASVTKN